MSSRIFKSIKINDKGVEMQWEESVTAEDGRVIVSNHTVESGARPHDDFGAAFRGIVKHIIPICELTHFKNKKGQPDDKLIMKHVLTSMHIYDRPDHMEIKVHINKYIESGKCTSFGSHLINLETEDYDDIDELRNEVLSVIDEANQYVTGKNGETQLELKFVAA